MKYVVDRAWKVSYFYGEFEERTKEGTHYACLLSGITRLLGDLKFVLLTHYVLVNNMS